MAHIVDFTPILIKEEVIEVPPSDLDTGEKTLEIKSEDTEGTIVEIKSEEVFCRVEEVGECPSEQLSTDDPSGDKMTLKIETADADEIESCDFNDEETIVGVEPDEIVRVVDVEEMRHERGCVSPKTRKSKQKCLQKLHLICEELSSVPWHESDFRVMKGNRNNGLPINFGAKQHLSKYLEKRCRNNESKRCRNNESSKVSRMKKKSFLQEINVEYSILVRRNKCLVEEANKLQNILHSAIKFLRNNLRKNISQSASLPDTTLSLKTSKKEINPDRDSDHLKKIQNDNKGFRKSKKRKDHDPDSHYDSDYFKKRQKNNEASRRSRKKKKALLKNIEIECNELEKQNKMLTAEAEKLQKRVQTAIKYLKVYVYNKS